MTVISLDSRLEDSSLSLGLLRFCEVRLVNEVRWPWLLLIPQASDLVELHKLTESQLVQVTMDTADSARVLSKVTDCGKINTGTLGNVVRQLHIHVIARNIGDANWPGPVWGFGERTPLPKQQFASLAMRLRTELFASSSNP